jgi:hypothetical protein
MIKKTLDLLMKLFCPDETGGCNPVTRCKCLWIKGYSVNSDQTLTYVEDFFPLKEDIADFIDRIDIYISNVYFNNNNELEIELNDASFTIVQCPNDEITYTNVEKIKFPTQGNINGCDNISLQTAKHIENIYND